MDDKLKKRLDKIRVDLQGIPRDALKTFWELNERHSYSARLDAHHSVRGLLSARNFCSKTWLIVLSGRDRTDSSGKAKILIDPLLCGVTREGFPFGERLVMVREPQFVATPHASSAVFVTVQTKTSSTQQPPQAGILIRDRDDNIIDQNSVSDVEVNITSWKHDGTPAPTTSFAWICTIEAAREIPFG
jgi:hypothetical protein